MIKYISLLFILLSLTSCFSWNAEVKTNTIVETWSISTGEIIPINEKSTKAEEEFSKDLNSLLKLVDEK